MSSAVPHLRFVVLRHTGHGAAHFDFMIETVPGASLMTFRCRNWPLSVGETIVRIADHRRAYLTYEGPVSRNRGEVRRIAEGTCERTSTESRMTIALQPPLAGLIVLRWIGTEDDPMSTTSESAQGEPATASAGIWEVICC